MSARANNVPANEVKNGLSLLTGALAALVVLLSFVGALGVAIVREATDASLYGERSRAAVKEAMGLASEDEVSAYIGVDEKTQAEFARQTALYMAYGKSGEAAALPLLSEREQAHMADVRALIAVCDRVKAFCVPLAAALTVAMAWTGVRLARRRRTAALGAAAGLGVLSLLIALGALYLHTAGFQRAFTDLHGRVFTNDLWLMNPRTDILIRMMPQLLFEQAAVRVARQTLSGFGLTLAMLLAIYALLDGMSRRQLTEKKQP